MALSIQSLISYVKTEEEGVQLTPVERELNLMLDELDEKNIHTSSIIQWSY